MHDSVMIWTARKAGKIKGEDVLELGSLDVNGSARSLWAHSARYVGIDMRAGPAVDVQALAGWLPFPDECFDIVISTEMLEHDLTFWFSLEDACRVLRPGGHLLVTCRGIRYPRHDHPGDYYRFTPAAMTALGWLFGLHELEVRQDPQLPGVFAHWQKPLSCQEEP